MSYIFNYKSPIGDIVIAAEENRITGLWFKNQKYFGSTLTEQNEEKKLTVFEKACDWLKIYFSGEEPSFTPDLRLKGSRFRHRVWDILLKIPYGEVITYKEIADKVALEKNVESMSAQAVGGAVAHNPISLIIPCHRVVGANGSLTGYAGGIDKKIKLLELEKIKTDRFFISKNGTVR